MALKGDIRVPSDKSLSHRAVLFAGLAKGCSVLRHVLPSADVHATIRAMELLGAVIQFEDGPYGLDGSVDGIDLKAHVDAPLTIDCGNSGTTTRLLMGALSGLGLDVTLTGDESLRMRPMKRVMKPLDALGARFESQDGRLPVRILPIESLHSASVEIEQASAQVKSAVLLAGMKASGITSVTEPSKSRDHTELLLPAFGVDVAIDGLTSRVEGPAHLHAHDMVIPGDPSSAAFVAVASVLIDGSDVLMKEVALNPTRTGAFEVLKRMGCKLEFENVRYEGSEPVGDVRARHSSQLNGIVVTAEEIPSLIDEIPILAIAAACANGETVFESCAELRVKESDRLDAIIEGLAAFGVKAFDEDDDLHIIGAGASDIDSIATVRLSSRADHRLAMTWYLAGMVFDADVQIDDRECVVVSWPDFFDDIDGLVC